VEIKEFSKKVEAMQEYFASKDEAKKGTLTHSGNAPITVELHFDSETRMFTVSGNEIGSLLAAPPDIDGINDLFRN
jgi:hypothetical protein